MQWQYVVARSVFALAALLVATGCLAAGAPAYPDRPIRLIVPFPPGGLDASSEQGSRSRDANVRESAAAAVLVAQVPVPREQYPNRPIRLIVPFPPGGGTDLVARAIQASMAAGLGQQVVLDNRGGAQGLLGTAIAAKSDPDGYTLVIAEIGAVAVAPSLADKLQFDPINDFAPITKLIEQPYIVSLHPSVPAQTLAEFIKVAQAKQGALNFGSGNATSHVAQEVFFQTAGIKLQHIPYRGSGPAMTALLGNEVQVIFSGPGAAIPQIKTNRIRALAVTTLKRSRELPNVPTIAEQGYKNFEISGWYGLAAPARTPRAIIDRVNAVTTALLTSGDAAQFLRDRGYEPAPTTPEEFGRYMKAEIVRWSKAVKQYNVKSID